MAEKNVMKTMAFELLHAADLLIVVNTEATPTLEDSGSMLPTIRNSASRNRPIKMLAVTEGGGPTSVQRKKILEALQGYDMPTAVVSDNLAVRCMVTAISWFNSKIKMFRKDEMALALSFLGVSTVYHKQVHFMVRELQEELRQAAKKAG